MNEETILQAGVKVKVGAWEILVNRLNKLWKSDDFSRIVPEIGFILLDKITEKHENLAFLLTVINKHPELAEITDIYKLVNYIIVLIDMEKANKDFVVGVDPNDFL